MPWLRSRREKYISEKALKGLTWASGKSIVTVCHWAMESDYLRQLPGSVSQDPCLQALKAFYPHIVHKGCPDQIEGKVRQS